MGNRFRVVKKLIKIHHKITDMKLAENKNPNRIIHAQLPKTIEKNIPENPRQKPIISSSGYINNKRLDIMAKTQMKNGNKTVSKSK